MHICYSPVNSIFMTANQQTHNYYRILKRFLLYRLCIIKFQRLGFTRVFSYNLGKEAGVTAEQVRKDFSVAGIKGSKRGGYDINHLLDSINDYSNSKVKGWLSWSEWAISVRPWLITWALKKIISEL